MPSITIKYQQIKLQRADWPDHKYSGKPASIIDLSMTDEQHLDALIELHAKASDWVRDKFAEHEAEDA